MSKEIMISINPPFTDMIFNGYKPFEFRNVVLRGLDEGYPIEATKAYIYETKTKGGAGAITGEVTICGCYCILRTCLNLITSKTWTLNHI